MPSLQFTVTSGLAPRSARARIDELVIAGWTGRDSDALEAHIRELEALGVARPGSTPVFYRVAASLLTQESCIQVLGPDSTGEAEVVIWGIGPEACVGLGSDHTDRGLERLGVAVSKQCCPKPVGPEVWPLADVAGHWPQLMLRSYIGTAEARQLYQEGTLAGLREPGDLIGRWAGKAALPEGTALFCGTLPVRGALRGASRFEMELVDPVLNRILRHAYEVTELPVVS